MSSNSYVVSDATITGIFTILGVILGFVLTRLSDHLSEGKRIRKGFDSLVNNLAYNSIINYYSPKLFEVRKFLLANANYMKVGANACFFEKWLLEPTELDAEPAPRIERNSLDHIKELRGDLRKLRPPSVLRGFWG